jgi:hypothetical protein
VRVALAASATPCHGDALTSGLQITDQLTRCAITDHGSNRNFDDAIIAAMPVTVAAHTMLPAASFVQLLITKVEQCRELRIGNGDHITAASPVPAARPAARDEFLAPKTDTAAPAVTGDHANFDFVNEFHAKLFRRDRSHNTPLFSPSCQMSGFCLLLVLFSSAGQKKSPEEGLSSSNAWSY